MRTTWLTAAAALGSVAVLIACGSRTGLGVFGAPGGTGGIAPTGSSTTTGAGGSPGSSGVAPSSGSAASSSSSAASSSSSGVVQDCPAGCAMGTPAFPPAVPLDPPGLPANCAGGFELNNLEKGSFVAPALSPTGAEARTLDVQIATYKAPDHIRVTGIDATNAEYVLVDTCDLQTATYGDPTNGCMRPPDDSIRQYKATVKAGTTSLTFDVSGGCTPFYVRVLGLCDFALVPPITGCKFRLIP